MESNNCLINKISDFLQDRDKSKNFGACKRCNKSVYWSKTKVVSHIRSGHCKGASRDEVKLFKDEFVYESPKSLVHKSTLSKKQNKPTNSSPGKKEKEALKSIVYYDNEMDDNEQEQHISYEVSNENDEEKLEVVFISNNHEQPATAVVEQTVETSKEEKFISIVYPHFKGKTKLDLIDEIEDLKRRNELLEAKVKTYEDTINKLIA